jgi:iron(II)-dependent oxidoreductase
MITTPLACDRQALIAWYRRNRRRSAELFALVGDEARCERPIPLRHPFVFYQGHLPAFSFNTLNVRALGEPPIDAELQRLFERGIDPGSTADAQRHDRSAWPSAQRVEAFARDCDQRVERALAHAEIERDDRPLLRRALSAYTILEHEAMHHETLLYIIHRLDRTRKGYVAQEHRDRPVPENDFCDIGAGTARMGSDPDREPFAWDNELPPTSVEVEAFGLMRYPVTNGDWLRFMDAGGPAPPFWIERDGEWLLLGQFDDLPLPLSWPVYVSHDQAAAYARWKGLRLPTEAEYHRAAFGAPDGLQRRFPWGDAPPEAVHGNFGFARFDPEPVDAHPGGASAWGVHDLVGNGWEWTASLFEPFPGFAPMPSYPQYSADFFDGRHYVLKGASPVTARELLRPGFRNWFYGDYPYVYAKFRCAANGTSER